MSAHRTPYRYGPSRTFMVVVGLVVAVQLWHALPDAPPSRVATADIEREIYADAQRGTTRMSDVRCTRVSPEAASCVALLADAVRVRVSARVDDRTGRVVWALRDPDPQAVR
jgi:hypothetical protein